MTNRRVAQEPTSDDEDDFPISRRLSLAIDKGQERKRKKMKLQEKDDEENEMKKNQMDGEEKSEEKEPELEDAKPLGEVVRVSAKGRERRNHYEAFEFDGTRYDLGDPILLTPEYKYQKPYVAIIKDITQTKDGSVMVTGQWFYRPEEAGKKRGGSWEPIDSRELFYSFHLDEVPAESVMHKCAVHFVPMHKQLPDRKQNPGFIVQKVYDTVEQKLWKLTDKDYEDDKQLEIDLLVQKTLSHLGELPDIEIEDTSAVVDRKEKFKAKGTLRKRSISPLNVIIRDDEGTTRSDQNLRAETLGRFTTNTTEYYKILSKSKVLTGETLRDKWMEKLLQGVQYMCNSPDKVYINDKVKGGSDSLERKRYTKSPGTANASEESSNSDKSFSWPDAAVPCVVALEKATYDALSSDFQKYNQKLRQLVFNLRNNPVLARRLLNGELEPSTMLNMSPNELKAGLIAEETTKKEPNESEPMQMTNIRCSRCMEFKVGLRDIIQAGHRDRYQLECIACGNSWYASRDAASLLITTEPSSSARASGKS